MILAFQVKEPEKKTPLGVLNLPLSRLINTSNMSLDQKFLLERSGINSQIKLKVTLRASTYSHHKFSTKIYLICSLAVVDYLIMIIIIIIYVHILNSAMSSIPQ